MIGIPSEKGRVTRSSRNPQPLYQLQWEPLYHFEKEPLYKPLEKLRYHPEEKSTLQSAR